MTDRYEIFPKKASYNEVIASFERKKVPSSFDAAVSAALYLQGRDKLL